jgi:site-specific recombinase XerD
MVRRAKSTKKEIVMRWESKEQGVAVAVPQPFALGELITAYLSDLARQGYRPTTIGGYRYDLQRFAGHVLGRRCRLEEMESRIEPFIAGTGWRGHGPTELRSVLGLFMKWLRRRGLASPVRQPSPPSFCAEMVEQYVRFQLEHRGICGEYSKELRRVCTAFLQSLWGKNCSRPRSIRPESIYRFVTSLGQRCSRVTMSSRCYILRGFLRFLYRRGVAARDLSLLVLVPIRFRHEDCPRFIGPDKLRKVLAAIDCSTSLGRRNYAMMMLLTVYGLRGIEVIRLRLEDIDWERAEIRIRSRKAGNTTKYPLAALVGRAILAYLRDGRPTSSDRHVFLSPKAPFRPLVYTAALGIQVRKYMKNAGVMAPRPGTHTLRYSCAQRLLDAGTPLKWISDYLGHRNINSTQRYLKIDIEQLREVALDDGEDVL